MTEFFEKQNDKKMIADDPTLTSNFETDLVTRPPCFSNLLSYIYRVNHRLAFSE